MGKINWNRPTFTKKRIQAKPEKLITDVTEELEKLNKKKVKKKRTVAKKKSIKKKKKISVKIAIKKTVKNKNDQIKIYTDGGCFVNPGGFGGWGVVFRDEKRKIGMNIYGGKAQTTNNEMELTALLYALENIKNTSYHYIIYSDSQYVVNSFTKWVDNWKKNNWRKKNGELIKNMTLIKAIHPLYNKIKPTLTWVKGHSGNEGNELADQLASRGAHNCKKGINEVKRKRYTI